MTKEELAKIIFEYIKSASSSIHVYSDDLADVEIWATLDIAELSEIIIDKISDEIYQDSDYVTYVPPGTLEWLDSQETPEPTETLKAAIRRARLSRSLTDENHGPGANTVEELRPEVRKYYGLD